MPMQVFLTAQLREELMTAGADPDQFVADFSEWKSGDEYGSYIFGKDGAYTTPTVDGRKYMLRHVHLIPQTDRRNLMAWTEKFRRRARKTSNRVLVYIEDRNPFSRRFLLIYILDEPDAHEIAQMKTPEHKQLMEAFAAIASDFFQTGSVRR